MNTRKLFAGFLLSLVFAGCDFLPETHKEHPGAEEFQVRIQVLPPDGTARVMGVDVDKVKPGSITAGTFNGTITVDRATVHSAGNDDVFLVQLRGDGSLGSLRRYGDEQEQTAADVATDGQDNIVLAGRFLGRMDFGDNVVITSQGTATNAFVAKLDRHGRALWALGIPLATDCCFISVDKVATDPSGNVILSGPLEGTAIIAGQPLPARGANNYLVKLSPAGEFVWGTVFRGPDQQVVGLKVRSDGQPVVAEVDARGVRFFLLRWSADGELLMDRAYADGFSQLLHDMALDEQNNIVISGTGVLGTPGTPEENAREFLALLDPQGDPIWVKRFTDRAFDHLATGRCARIFVAGRLFVPATPVSTQLAFVAAFDELGDEKWIRELAPGMRVDDLAESCASNLVLAGALGDSNFSGGPTVPTADLFIESLHP